MLCIIIYPLQTENLTSSLFLRVYFSVMAFNLSSISLSLLSSSHNPTNYERKKNRKNLKCLHESILSSSVPWARTSTIHDAMGWDIWYVIQCTISFSSQGENMAFFSNLPVLHRQVIKYIRWSPSCSSYEPRRVWFTFTFTFTPWEPIFVLLQLHPPFFDIYDDPITYLTCLCTKYLHETFPLRIPLYLTM